MAIIYSTQNDNTMYNQFHHINVVLLQGFMLGKAVCFINTGLPPESLLF